MPLPFYSAVEAPQAVQAKKNFEKYEMLIYHMRALNVSASWDSHRWLNNNHIVINHTRVDFGNVPIEYTALKQRLRSYCANERIIEFLVGLISFEAFYAMLNGLKEKLSPAISEENVNVEDQITIFFRNVIGVNIQHTRIWFSPGQTIPQIQLTVNFTLSCELKCALPKIDDFQITTSTGSLPEKRFYDHLLVVRHDALDVGSIENFQKTFFNTINTTYANYFATIISITNTRTVVIDIVKEWIRNPDYKFNGMRISGLVPAICATYAPVTREKIISDERINVGYYYRGMDFIRNFIMQRGFTDEQARFLAYCMTQHSLGGLGVFMVTLLQIPLNVYPDYNCHVVYDSNNVIVTGNHSHADISIIYHFELTLVKGDERFSIMILPVTINIKWQWPLPDGLPYITHLAINSGVDDMLIPRTALSWRALVRESLPAPEKIQAFLDEQTQKLRDEQERRHYKRPPFTIN